VNNQFASTVLDRMFRICDQHDGAKWFPPASFNVRAWAVACDVSDSTIDAWLTRLDVEIAKRPGGGSKAERYIDVRDFWPAIAAGVGSAEETKPRRRRG
jgi:hypothetical protein